MLTPLFPPWQGGDSAVCPQDYRWCGWEDSNLQILVPKTNAYAIRLHPHKSDLFMYWWSHQPPSAWFYYSLDHGILRLPFTSPSFSLERSFAASHISHIQYCSNHELGSRSWLLELVVVERVNPCIRPLLVGEVGADPTVPEDKGFTVPRSCRFATPPSVTVFW